MLKGTDSKIKYQQVYANIPKDHIAYLIYDLFVNKELNAHVSQFYSELEKSNTQREQFNQFSAAYKIHDGYMYIIEKLEENKGWETGAMQYFKKRVIKRFKSVNMFRSCFLGRAKYKASKFYNKLCKVANLYYDTIEGIN